MFWVWIIVFGVPMGVLTYATSQDSLAPIGLTRLLLLGDFLTVFGAGIMAWVASANAKKKMLEENHQEEQQKRGEHYQRLEGLIEKMSETRENG